MASAPGSDDDENQNVNAFDVNAHFSPSMAIILVVLLSAFFFMAFFSIYVKRCSTRADDPRTRGTPAPQTHPAEAPSQGLDPAFLETLPLVAYSSSKKKGSNIECVVCLTDFEEGEPLCQLPRCKHVFHKDCIDMWLFSHTTCPLCRRSVISDGTRSFRWGGGSGSLRLSLARRGSGRGSAGVTGPSTPIEEQARRPDGEEHGNLDSLERRRLRRSHSTGHSMVKQAQSSGGRGRGLAEHVDAEEVQESSSGGCLPLTPQAAFQRSRSYAAFGGDIAAVQIGISGWMRDAGASVKRALSLKRVSPAGPFAASSSSSSSSAAPSAFDRISPV